MQKVVIGFGLLTRVDRKIPIALNKIFSNRVFSERIKITSIPMILALPPVGKIRFSNIRIVVDLPAPFGPIKPKISPSPISRLTCSIPLAFP